MIKKPKHIQLIIILLYRLLLRLPLNYELRSKIEKELVNWLSGYNGERSMNFFLSELPDDYYIFHDIHLPGKKSTFQIDILLLTRKYALLLEVKNFFGIVHFDKDSKQFTRRKNENDIPEGYPNPITQVESQHEKILTLLLKKRSIPENFPIEHIVIFSHPKTMIEASHPSIFETVMHAHDVPNKIKSLDEKYQQQIISQNELKNISKMLLREHSPSPIDLLSTFEINPNILLKGIQCPNCSKFYLEKYKRAWQCTSCPLRSRKIQDLPILDFLFLIQPTITRSQCKDFLKLSSPNVVSNLLSSSNLVSSGVKKGRVYHRPVIHPDCLNEKIIGEIRNYLKDRGYYNY